MTLRPDGGQSASYKTALLAALALDAPRDQGQPARADLQPVSSRPKSGIDKRRHPRHARRIPCELFIRGDLGQGQSLRAQLSCVQPAIAVGLVPAAIGAVGAVGSGDLRREYKPTPALLAAFVVTAALEHLRGLGPDRTEQVPGVDAKTVDIPLRVVYDPRARMSVESLIDEDLRDEARRALEVPLAHVIGQTTRGFDPEARLLHKRQSGGRKVSVSESVRSQPATASAINAK
jgi:hypothetical protein